jgi:uncharacterized damage-inducible protein DinB
MTNAVSPIVTLFRHNLWANLRLLDACIGLTDEQLEATLIGSFGSIRSTLFHIVSAEGNYGSLLTGEPRNEKLKRGQNPTLSELRNLAKMTGEQLCEVAARTTATDMTYPEWDGRRWPVPAATVLTQAINHGTEHRAQVSAILTQLGIEPPEMDGWTYYVTEQALLS